VTDTRTYVLDTSVLLSDPWGVQPVCRTRSGGSAGGNQRTGSQTSPPRAGMVCPSGIALVRRYAGWSTDGLINPFPLAHKAVRFTSSSITPTRRCWPAGFRTDSNDSRILSCAANLAAEGKRVTLVSKDIPLRVKAAAVGLAADE